MKKEDKLSKSSVSISTCKKQLILIFLSLVFFIALFFFCSGKIVDLISGSVSNSKELLKLSDNDKIDIILNEKKFEVEVVNTHISRNRGLSGRAEIGSDGMLFVFPEKTVPMFWMKDMEFDLDFIWIDGGKIVDVENNVPHHEDKIADKDLPLLLPDQKVDLVLEVDSGFIERNGIEVGQKIRVSQED